MFGDGGHRLGGAGYDRAPGDNEFPDCDPMNAVENPIMLGGSLLCLVAVGAAAVMSLGVVPPLHYAIKYNSFTKVADMSQVYSPGRYLCGPFNKFLLFPSTVQTIEFTDEMRLGAAGLRYPPLHTRTRDGLGLHLQVSLQYKLQKERLTQLYNEFNQNYEPVISSSVRDTLIKAASEYQASQLWKERSQFGDKMQSMVNSQLSRAFAECWGLQLLIIDLPDDFESKITQTQLQNQQLLIKLQEQKSTQIRAYINVTQAEFNSTVTALMAEGRANYTLLTKQATAKANQRKIRVEAEVMQNVGINLGLDPSGLILYQRYAAMDDLTDASLYFGFSSPSSLMVGESR